MIRQYNHDHHSGSADIEASDDWDLVRYCRDDKERCFPVLMRRHYALVVNMGYRFFSDRSLAEDMAQEVFLTVYREVATLQQGAQPFVHWLCRITSNACRSFYRKKSSEKRTITAGKVDYWFGDEGFSGDTTIDDKTGSAIRYVNDALACLKPDERMALVLSHVAGLKTREIAPMIRVPEYTIRRLLKRAEEKMRRLITQRTAGHHAP